MEEASLTLPGWQVWIGNMTFREWLRDPRCESERHQAAFLGVVVAVAMVGVIILGVVKQCQMDRERLPIESPPKVEQAPSGEEKQEQTPQPAP